MTGEHADIQALFEAWRAGDPKAGAQLFDRCYDNVSRFFANKVPEAHQEDLVQSSFLALLEAADRFKGYSSFHTFLIAIAKNKLLDFVRKTARRGKYESPASDWEAISAADLGPSPSSGAARREEQRLLLE